MRLVGHQQIECLLPAQGAAHESLAGQTGSLGKPEAGPTSDADLGTAGHLPAAPDSKPAPGHKVYPYLLGGMEITGPNQVWAADITYIPMARGFLYLVASMDWYSRYVVAWRLSNTLDADFCVETLEEALSKGKPEVFNTDQGSQFTSEGFTELLEEPLPKRTWPS